LLFLVVIVIDFYIFCFDVWEQGLVTGLMLMNQLLKLKQIRCYV
jgi:hypothetical protein